MRLGGRYYYGKIVLQSPYDHSIVTYYYCYSVAKLRLTICDPMDCSMQGFPVLPYFLECSDSCPLNRRCCLTSSSSATLFSCCVWSFPTSGSFPVSQHFISGGQSNGASASASVLLMNIQGWFLLGLTSLISLQSKGLSRVFSNNTTWRHQFFGAQPS